MSHIRRPRGPSRVAITLSLPVGPFGVDRVLDRLPPTKPANWLVR